MSDLDQLMAVMEAGFDPHFGEAWTRAQVESSLAMPHTYAVLLDREALPAGPDNPAAGFLLARRAPGEEELLLIAVRPEHRRRGIGRALLERFHQLAAAAGAERVFLEMRSNNPAVGLYTAMGYCPIGERRAYYKLADGSRLDAVTFGKTF